MKNPLAETLRADVPWKKAYPVIDEIVRGYLSGLEGTLSTLELAEALAGPGKQRVRLMRALQSMAENSLGDCATRGLVDQRGMRPWRWHAPKSAFNDTAIENLTLRGALKLPCVCPHCGGKL